MYEAHGIRGSLGEGPHRRDDGDAAGKRGDALMSGCTAFAGAERGGARSRCMEPTLFVAMRWSERE